MTVTVGALSPCGACERSQAKQSYGIRLLSDFKWTGAICVAESALLIQSRRASLDVERLALPDIYRGAYLFQETVVTYASLFHTLVKWHRLPLLRWPHDVKSHYLSLSPWQHRCTRGFAVRLHGFPD